MELANDKIFLLEGEKMMKVTVWLIEMKACSSSGPFWLS